MKKQLLSLALLALGTMSVKAQTIVNDSVLIGSANESWYKLSDGTRTADARANWDLAFTTDNYDVTVLFNHAIGNNVYIATGATPATFTAVTSADAATTPLYNSDSTWTLGALNQQPAGAYNYGWGSYNTSTHNISGNRVFIVQFSGGTYKKFYIQDLNNSSMPYVYTLVYSDIDNSNPHTVVIPKQTYGTKNFIYYSFTTDAIVDREPASTDWDLLFTKYTSTSELYQGSANQVVAGVLQNAGVLAAQTNSVAAPATYTTYTAHTFSTTANVIGWDWKGLNASFQYTVEPARVYFVKTSDSNIYKIIFSSYAGSTSGKFKFSKELLQTSTLVNEIGATISTMALYPNPSSGDNTTLLFSIINQVSNASVSITDITGKLISNEQLTVTSGLNQHNVYTGNLNSGVYFISVKADGYTTTQKLIKQ